MEFHFNSLFFKVIEMLPQVLLIYCTFMCELISRFIVF